MSATTNHKTALLFALLFITIAVAPSVVLSIDNRADVAIFFGENEEEETESLKILFEVSSEALNQEVFVKVEDRRDNYYFKNYPTPHLNLIFPPPEYTL